MKCTPFTVPSSTPVMTRAAGEFVTPLSVSALAGVLLVSRTTHWVLALADP